LKNYLNSCNQNFGSHWWILLLKFLVLTCESDSCTLQFLNKLNLTYQRSTDFVVSSYFISIVLVAWGKFSLCSLIISFLAFRGQISILIVGCLTTWSRGSHQFDNYDIWISRQNLNLILLGSYHKAESYHIIFVATFRYLKSYEIDCWSCLPFSFLVCLE
jgi:hypothetical protein